MSLERASLWIGVVALTLCIAGFCLAVAVLIGILSGAIAVCPS